MVKMQWDLDDWGFIGVSAVTLSKIVQSFSRYLYISVPRQQLYPYKLFHSIQCITIVWNDTCYYLLAKAAQAHPLYSWHSRTSNSSNAIFQPRPLWCWYVWNKIHTNFHTMRNLIFNIFPYLLSRKGLIPRNITMRRNNNSNTLHFATPCSIFNGGRNHQGGTGRPFFP